MSVTSSRLACISHGLADTCERQVLDCHALLSLSHRDCFYITSCSDAMVKLQELVANRPGISVCAYNDDIPQGNMLKALQGCCLNLNTHQP